jgi:dTDP-4-amino-4,6-dideoxygalactose transaminase
MGQLPASHTAFRQTVTLPLYPQIHESDLDMIADALDKVVKRQQ